MPRAIADSDDEDDDIVVASKSQIAVVEESANQDQMDASVGVITLDRAAANSTGSTERLRRQIESAERGFISKSTSGEVTEAALNMASSPSARAAAKRRHNSAFASQTEISPAQSVKRTKSLKTYGTAQRSHVTDNAGFDKTNIANALNTSQSAAFTEHSGIHSSAALPSGSIHEDFVNHEPNEMFPESGSTVADNSSTERKMLAEAQVEPHKMLTTSAINVIVTHEPKSSSVPFTASDSNNATQSNERRQPTRAATPIIYAEDELHDYDDSIDVAGPSEHEGRPCVEQQDHSPELMADIIARLGPQASPTVEITSTKTARRDSNSSESGAKGRKRKAQRTHESSDPLNSDDRAIGLPKERYQPRPSKRRATQVVEEPVDFSVCPEKAAKVKRTRTADGVARSSTKSSPEAIVVVEETAASTAEKTSEKPEDIGSKSAETATDPTATQLENSQGSKEAEPTNSQAKESPALQSTAAPQTSQSVANGDVFLKPSKPTPKIRSTKKAKRAVTTIFEDHVEFMGSQRAPTLSQQQAKRKSALSDVQSNSKTSKKKRKVADSDDEEGEHKTLEENEEEDETPKKKARGRPAKSTAKSQPKSSEKVVDEEDEEDKHPADDEDAPPKRGRGRPPKGAAEVQSIDAVNDRAAKQTPHGPPKERTEQRAGSEAGGSPEEPDVDINAKSSVDSDADKIPTPPPEKEKENTPQKAPVKGAPTSHSPIKSSLKVPLRVGLSKHSRIPSLLSIKKPAKR